MIISPAFDGTPDSYFVLVIQAWRELKLTLMACSQQSVYPLHHSGGHSKRLSGVTCLSHTFILSQSPPHRASSSWTTPTNVSKQIRPWDVFSVQTLMLNCFGMRANMSEWNNPSRHVQIYRHTFTHPERCRKWTLILNGHDCASSLFLLDLIPYSVSRKCIDSHLHWEWTTHICD